MTPLSKRIDSQYFCHQFGGIKNFYELSTTKGFNEVDEQPLVIYKSVSEITEAGLKTLFDTIETSYNTSCESIAKRYEHILEKNTLAMDFSNWIQTNFYFNLTQLKLHKLGIEMLPPQIQLFTKLEVLDISDNQLLNLPLALRKLPLKRLDISGNVHLQPRIPSWLGESGLTLVAYRIKLTYVPKGFTAEQIEK